jgi:hypothetical protein
MLTVSGLKIGQTRLRQSIVYLGAYARKKSLQKAERYVSRGAGQRRTAPFSRFRAGNDRDLVCHISTSTTTRR